MIFKKALSENPSNFVSENIKPAARRAFRRFAVLLVGMLIFSLAAATAQAKVFTVTKVADSDDNMCDADCSLREAIGRAGSEITDDVITFAPSVFSTPRTLFVPGFFVVRNSEGTLTIDGPGADLLTLRPAGSFGRIVYLDGGTLTLNGLKLTGGNLLGGALQGGAIAKQGNGTLTVNNCIITGNAADTGGAIGSSGGRIIINNSTLSGNTAAFQGGALLSGGAVDAPGITVINNSTISGNNLTNAGGGGAGIVVAGSSTLTLTNSTVSGNSANASNGGGIYSASGLTNLINATIVANTASNGGGIYALGLTAVNARSSIIANNSANSNPDFSGRLDSQGYNLLETFPTTMTGNQTGNIYGQDPQLAPLADNGGATYTHALLAGSPAIDAADPNNFPPTDQRRLARPADGDGNGSRRADIGAFERSAVPPYRPFDFDGDGRADVSVFRPAEGVWYLLRSTQGFTGVQFGIAGDRIVPADYDGDGRTDIAVYRPSDGVWYLLQSSGGFRPAAFGISEDIPVPADYDGDGKANLAVFRPSTGAWYIARPTGVPSQNFDTVSFGASGDKPIAGADFDGDGKADIAVFRPSNGYWYRLNSSNGQFAATQFGVAEDKPAAADYDGDGKTDIAVWRPSDGVWYILQSINGLFTPVQFGADGDVAVAADYDGDGRANLAVFRPLTNSWYIGRAYGAPSQNFDTVVFGVATDKPVPGAFVP